MPNHTKQRIASLRELIEGGLHAENLDRIVAECNALAQDTSNVLTFFILRQVFAEMSAALDGEAVAVTQHKDLVSGIAEPSILILEKIMNDERIETADLELIVRTHIRNVNVFRSDR
jgi:hypothetical protein